MKRIILRLKTFAFLSITLLALCVPSNAAPRVVHVFVALADNQHQGIIPVPAALGNGRDPQRNLYWGAASQRRKTSLIVFGRACVIGRYCVWGAWNSFCETRARP